MSATGEEEQLQARVAWYYYVGHLTQQQIATRLGTSRVRINRLLSACGESGLVKISINSRLAECVELEQALVTGFGLRAAVVVPTPPDPDLVREAIGVGAAACLTELIHDGHTVAIGWGRTLTHIRRALPARSCRATAVASLQGGLSHCSEINTFEIVSDFATLFSADCYFFPAPIYAASETARDVILAQEGIRETWHKAVAADVGIVTVGDMRHSLIATYGLSGADELAALMRAGAVGDLIGHFIDAEGKLVDHPLNRRIIAVGLDDLRQIGTVVLAAGGQSKVPVMRAVLRAGYANVLVCDEAAARKLVATK